jgi:hypothetical protein
MKKTRAAILIGEEEGFAIFDTDKVGDRYFFLLVRADSQGQGQVLFHPDERFLSRATQEGLDFRYEGEPIPVEKYLHFPQERCKRHPEHLYPSQSEMS